MHFSSLADSLAASKNPLYVLHDELRAAGHPILDLVKGNVNEHGIVFPQEALREILREASDQSPSLQTRFAGPARSARGDFLLLRWHRIPAAQIVITPGTSVSYWYCFKLLAEPGTKSLRRNLPIRCSTTSPGSAASL